MLAHDWARRLWQQSSQDNLLTAKRRVRWPCMDLGDGASGTDPVLTLALALLLANILLFWASCKP